jgi:hypothetical protein
MAATTNRYTNVTNCTFNGIDLPNVKSVSWEAETAPLEGQSTGARQPEIIGVLSRTKTATVECEDGGSRPSIEGIANAGNLVFTVQQDSDKDIVKTFTITNMYSTGDSYATDQGAPNMFTFNFQAINEESEVSYA